jgi:hypothetical protein
MELIMNIRHDFAVFRSSVSHRDRSRRSPLHSKAARDGNFFSCEFPLPSQFASGDQIAIDVCSVCRISQRRPLAAIDAKRGSKETGRRARLPDFQSSLSLAKMGDRRLLCRGTVEVGIHVHAKGGIVAASASLALSIPKRS